MEDIKPSEGIWLVKHKNYSTSCTRIMKNDELSEKWPLLHYYEYKDEIIDALYKNKISLSIENIVDFALNIIKEKYLEDKSDKDMSIENIYDLYE